MLHHVRQGSTNSIQGTFDININSITDEKIKEGTEEFYKNFSIPVDRVAETIQQSIDLPSDAAWNEVVIRPTAQQM